VKAKIMPKINVYLPDDLADAVRQHQIPVSAICQVALRRETERLKVKEDTDLDHIIVQVGDPAYSTGFVGQWLVVPDADTTHSNGHGQDVDAYWGVAVTRRGRIAVYAAHRKALWPARLDDYDSLEHAADDDVPSDILALAAPAILSDDVIWRDI
jgi:hypothetical protein